MTTTPDTPPDLAEVLIGHQVDKRIDILRRIGASGSISEAARSAGVSYKAAWQTIETLDNLAGTPLVDKAVGGRGGGGAALTPAGRRVLEAAALLARARTEVLERFGPGATGHGEPGMAALALRTSMRNQFPCTVRTVTRRQGFVRVELALADDSRLHARITRESAELLGIQPGLPVLALCKATAVTIAAAIDADDGRNRMAGIVIGDPRPAGGESSIRLAAGIRIVGFAAPGHGLKAGAAATAALDESAVVIAISG